MGRPKKNGNYFTEETDKAVVAYQNTEDERERNRIFNKQLYVPLKKICEVYANSIDHSYVDESLEDRINDCLAHLVTSAIFKFNPAAGKAYSYFSVSAKFFFMQLNMKGYAKAKSKRGYESLDGVDGIDETIEEDAYTQMFIERYYAFIEWFTMHLPDIYYTKGIKQHMWYVLEFMDAGMDSVNDFLKIRVAEKFKERYPDAKEVHTRFARISIYEQYLHFIKEWEKGILNPIPIRREVSNYRTSTRLTELNGGGTEKNKNRRNYDRYYKSKKKNPAY
jgi:hypothetical protein